MEDPSILLAFQHLVQFGDQAFDLLAGQPVGEQY